MRSLKLTSWFTRHAQSLAWFILYPFFHLFFRIEIVGQEKLKHISYPVIIVANHIRFYDSFLFSIVFGPYAKILPLRFMAVNKFDNSFLNFLNEIGLIPLVYTLFSVFIVTPGLGLEKNLETSQKILAYGQSVVIYPEGSLIHNNHVGPFKHGAAALATMTGKPVLPVSFRKTFYPGLRALIKITIGDTVTLKPNTDYEEGSAQLQKMVSNLYMA